MPSIFSKIVSGEINCHKIHENDEFLAFLDVNPLAIGHTLVIPKIEVDYIFDIEDHILSRMIVFSKNVAKQLQSKIDCKRIGVAIIGLEVPHAHIHLIPLNTVQDINFSAPKLTITNDKLSELSKLVSF
jgi:histidine triad (HIT) family protein